MCPRRGCARKGSCSGSPIGRPRGAGRAEGVSAQDEAKRAAADAAVALVESGMRLGLGTGSTAHFVVETLGRRVREEGLQVIGVPTSVATAEHARRLNIPLAELAE